MIAAREVPPPEPRELRACGLAALAEAAVLVLPLYLLVTEARGLDVSITASAIAFVAAFVGGTLLACRFRGSRNLAAGAAVLAVLAGIWMGRADLNRSVFMVVLALLVAVRVVTLGLRDWRLPVHAEFGWLAVALGLETMLAAGGQPEWRGPLLVAVPVFFVAMLASRTTTVWSSAGAGELDADVRANWIRRAFLATGGLLVAMVGLVLLAVRGGAFEQIGRWLTPVADAIAAFLGAVLAQAARPVFWLVDRFGIDPDRVRDFLDRLGEGPLGEATADEASQPGAALWQRLLGLLVFAAIAYAIVRAIRRFRPDLGLERPARTAGTSVETPSPAREILPSKPLLRREPPADAVRRWYGEALAALRRRDVTRDHAQTPGEFAPQVAAAFPDVAEEFASLTHAYEDVRYGSLRLDRSELNRIRRGHERLLAIVDRRPS